MNAYKFDVSISQEGIIQLPISEDKLLGQEVEIIIIPRIKRKVKEKTYTARDFVNKWAGFFQEIDVDQAKYEYLMQKYK